MKRRVNLSSDEEILRKSLFVICKSKEALGRWIRTYLDIDLPDCIVDPESTASPLDLLWEVYSEALENTGDYTSVMAYASRGSAKTLGASILEVLCLFHLGRDVAHMAAIESQAKKAAGYASTALQKPYLREFVTSKNERKLEITWYVKKGRPVTEALNLKEFESLTDAEKNHYIENKRYIVIVICTATGSNSEHTTFFCVDGDTKILVRYDDSKNAVHRERCARTARGVFNRLAGVPHGGRPAPLVEPMSVEAPKQLIEALSFNHANGQFEFKPITHAIRQNKNTDELTFDDGSRLICTADHPIFVIGRGYTEASDLRLGDKVIAAGKAKSSRNQIKLSDKTLYDEAAPEFSSTDDPFEQALLGSLLGDGGVYKKEKNNGYFQERHCVEQAGYLAWKEQFFRLKLRTRPLVNIVSGYTGGPQVGFCTGNSSILNEYADFKTTFHNLERLGPMGLAVWYMEDGCKGQSFRLSTECFTEDQNKKLAQFLSSRFDIEATVGSYSREDKTYFYLHGSVTAKIKLTRICTPFIHPSMAYKFDLDQHTGTCRICGEGYFYVDFRGVTCGKALCRSVQLGTLSTPALVGIKPAGQRVVYDFTVEGNNNFFGNGLLNKNCLDEVDLVANIDAYEESRFIPDARAGINPITLMISTRKYSWSLVQKEIDNAPNSGLKLLHWNAIDVMQKCSPEIHHPELPQVPIFSSRKTLQVLSAKQFSELNPEEQTHFEESVGYDGCLNNCNLYAGCRGNSVKFQQSTSSMLKPVKSVQDLFRKSTLQKARTQLMCWTPTEEGRVYSQFDRNTHMLTPAQIAERLTGEPHAPAFTKHQLLELAISKGLPFYAGMDFGFTHNFAVVMGFVALNRLYVTTVVAASGLGPKEKLIVCNDTIKPYSPAIFPDPENPDLSKYFRQDGYHVRTWKKVAGSVLTGIETMRYKLNPTGMEPEMYLLAEDDGCAMMAKALEDYHWKLDSAGKSLGIPDDEDDDIADAARYLVMNVFAPKGRSSSNEAGNAAQTTSTEQPVQYGANNWMSQVLEETLQDAPPADSFKIKKGGFTFEV